MKGIAKIQLIDDATGEVVYEKVEENYITSLYQDFNNKCESHSKINYNPMLAYPFKDYCQGIILLGNTQPLSGKSFLHKDDTIIGYASDTYSGSDVKRGSLNVLESQDITDGYRKVWDFGTGVAVGDINSIALTDGFGGTNDINQQASTRDTFDGGVHGQILYSDTTTGSGNSYMCRRINAGYEIWTKTDTSWENGNEFDFDNFYVISDDMQFDYSYGFGYQPNFLHYDKHVSSMLVDFSGTLQAVPSGYTRQGVPYVDANYLYVYHYDSSVGIKIHRYNITTGAYVDELTYLHSSLSYSSAPFLVNDDYIFTTQSEFIKIIKRSDSSIIEKTIATGLVGYNNNYGKSLNMAWSTKYTNTVVIAVNSLDQSDFAYVFYDIDNDRFFGAYCVDGFGLYNTGIMGMIVDEPLIYLGYGLSGESFGQVILNEPYPLATINNLGSTLTKGSAQSLKVIYEITW